MYTLQNQNKKNLDICQAPRYIQVSGINKIKKANFLNKNKSSKIVMVVSSKL